MPGLVPEHRSAAPVEGHPDHPIGERGLSGWHLPPRPGRRMDLVATEVQMAVGEEARELVDQSLDELERVGRLGIDRDLGDAGGPASVPGCRGATSDQVRVGGQPGRRVARHVELGHDAYPEAPGVVDECPNLVVAQVSAVLGDGVQARPHCALDPVRLVVGEVQVQDVQVEQRHGIECAMQCLGSDPVPTDVDQQPTPGQGCGSVAVIAARSGPRPRRSVPRCAHRAVRVHRARPGSHGPVSTELAPRITVETLGLAAHQAIASCAVVTSSSDAIAASSRTFRFRSWSVSMSFSHS